MINMVTKIIPLWFVKKSGSVYRFYSLKGIYDSASKLWKGEKAKEGAKKFANWQRTVNEAVPMIRKFGTRHVVYISQPFKTKSEAEKYGHNMFPGPMEYR